MNGMCVSNVMTIPHPSTWSSIDEHQWLVDRYGAQYVQACAQKGVPVNLTPDEVLVENQAGDANKGYDLLVNFQGNVSVHIR